MIMDNNTNEQFQVSNLQKLSYAFFESIANGEEHLTYTSKIDNEEVQVEVNVVIEKEFLNITVDFDTAWGGRWKKTSNAKVYQLNSNEVWTEIV
jgi:hypothetical protein